jgi:hypothetical protein
MTSFSLNMVARIDHTMPGSTTPFCAGSSVAQKRRLITLVIVQSPFAGVTGKNSI